METQFIEWIVGQVGMAGIAGLCLWWLMQTAKRRLLDEKQYGEERLAAAKERNRQTEERNRKTEIRENKLHDVLENNTIALVRMTSVMDSLSDEIKRNNGRA